MSKTTTLINLIKSGDQESFEKISTMYFPLLVSICRSFKTSMEFEDLMQHALISLYQATLNYEEKNGVLFSTYLVSCVKNRLLSSIKKHDRLNCIDLCDDDISKCVIHEDKVVDKVYLDQYLLGIKRLLSSRENIVLGLYIDGYSYQEISKMLKISIKSVDNSLYRIRKKLKSIER